MRVGIPLFGKYISPRFDCAESMLLIDIGKSSVNEEKVLDIGNWPPSLKNSLLSKLKVDVLLCGGIKKIDYLELKGLGIKVYPSLRGEVEEIKKAFLEGRISDSSQRQVYGVVRKGEKGQQGKTKSNTKKTL